MAKYARPPVVIVTGCSKGGMGFALCNEFASKGCKVYATGRRVEAMKDLEHESIEHLKLDVTDDANVLEVVKTIMEREGRIDILVNNAGVPCSGPTVDVSMAQTFSTFDANTFAILRTVKAVFPHMAARKSGTIVNVGSIVGDTPPPWSGVYAASKAAVRSLSETLYMECAPFNISVVHIAPGGVRTHIAGTMLDRFSLPADSMYSRWLESITWSIDVGRKGWALSPEAYARNVVRALLSSRPPRYMTLGSGATTFTLFKWLPRGPVLWILWRSVATLGSSVSRWLR